MSINLTGKAVKTLRLPTVDYNSSPIKVINAQAGDIDSRIFLIELYDDAGDIDLSIYDYVKLNATLPDGSKQVTSGEIVGVAETGKWQACVCATTSMLTQAGKVSCDITLYSVRDRVVTRSLTSRTFYLFVTQSQTSNSAEEGTPTLYSIEVVDTDGNIHTVTTLTFVEEGAENSSDSSDYQGIAIENSDGSIQQVATLTFTDEETNAEGEHKEGVL